MAWCGCSRKGRQSLASSGGGGAGWSVSTSTPYILWGRRSSKALRPFSGDVYGWVFCAKNWQLRAVLDSTPLFGAGRVEDTLNLLGHALRKAVGLVAQELGTSAEAVVEDAGVALVGHNRLKTALGLGWGEPHA